MKTCAEVAPLLAFRKLDVLEDDERAAIDEHVASCATCPALARELEAALEAEAGSAPKAPPPSTDARIRELLARDPPRLVSGPVVVLSCTFCHGALARHEPVYCAGCLAPYHEDCFRENGRCGVAGCGDPRVVGTTRLAPARKRRAIVLPALVLLVGAGAGAAAVTLRGAPENQVAVLPPPSPPAPVAPVAPPPPPPAPVAKPTEAELGPDEWSAAAAWRSLALGSGFKIDVSSVTEDLGSGTVKHQETVTETLTARDDHGVELRIERSVLHEGTIHEEQHLLFADLPRLEDKDALGETIEVPAGSFRCRRFVQEVVLAGRKTKRELWVSDELPVPVKELVRNDRMTETRVLTKVLAPVLVYKALLRHEIVYCQILDRNDPHATTVAVARSKNDAVVATLGGDVLSIDLRSSSVSKREERSASVAVCAFSADRGRALIATKEGALEYLLKDGWTVAHLSSSVAVSSVDIAPDGARGLVGYRDGLVRLFELPSFHEVLSFRVAPEGPELAEPQNLVFSAMFDPPGDLVLRFEDGSDYRLSGTLAEADRKKIVALAYTLESGTAVAVELVDGRIVSMVKGSHRFPRSRPEVLQARDVVDRLRTMLGLVRDRDSQSWKDLRAELKKSLATLAELTRRGPRWNLVRFSPDGKHALTVGQGLKLWDLTSGKVERWLDELGSASEIAPLSCCAATFTADGEKVFAHTFGDTFVWDTKTGLVRSLKRLNGAGEAPAVAVSPDSAHGFALSPETGQLRVFDLVKFVELPALNLELRPGHEPRSLAFSKDGARFLVGTTKGTIVDYELVLVPE